MSNPIITTKHQMPANPGVRCVPYESADLNAQAVKEMQPQQGAHDPAGESVSETQPLLKPANNPLYEWRARNDDYSQHKSDSYAPPDDVAEHKYKLLSPLRTFMVIFSLTCITFISSAVTGLLTVGLPEIARDLELPEHLLLWPVSVYNLACGSCLLVAGVIADLTNPRWVNLSGTLLLGVTILCVGHARDGYLLIAARTTQGVAVSMCFPTSIAIITATFPPSRARNLGFSSLGLAQPLGFSLGLIFEGLVQKTAYGWRFGFYLFGAYTMTLAVANFLIVPSGNWPPIRPLAKILRSVDWIGVMISSVCLGCSSYSFAILADSVEAIKAPGNLAALFLAVALFPAFFGWMHRQEKLGRPTLIPNSLWRDIPFLSICLLVLLQWAVIQSMEIFYSLFFQNIQGLPPIKASLNFLPNIIIGVILNISTGLFVQHIRTDFLVTVMSVLAAGSPLLMAVIDPAWSYWFCAFWSMLLGPVSVDVIFTIAHLIVVEVFPPQTHALAGAVFNTVAQFGSSVGIATMAIISSIATKSYYSPNPPPATDLSPEALMYGYRAVFWTCFGLMAFTCFISQLGLRTVGKLGVHSNP